MERAGQAIRKLRPDPGARPVRTKNDVNAATIIHRLPDERTHAQDLIVLVRGKDNNVLILGHRGVHARIATFEQGRDGLLDVRAKRRRSPKDVATGDLGLYRSNVVRGFKSPERRKQEDTLSSSNQRPTGEGVWEVLARSDAHDRGGRARGNRMAGNGLRGLITSLSSPTLDLQAGQL